MGWSGRIVVIIWWTELYSYLKNKESRGISHTLDSGWPCSQDFFDREPQDLVGDSHGMPCTQCVACWQLVNYVVSPGCFFLSLLTCPTCHFISLPKMEKSTKETQDCPSCCFSPLLACLPLENGSQEAGKQVKWVIRDSCSRLF